MTALGLDTSNYTTSAAWFDGQEGENTGHLLEVRPGELGLRQSDALFQHVKRMPEIMDNLMETLGDRRITAVGASTRPRSVESSYMPCFLAGESQGRTLARTLGIPFYPFSHQQGHLAAVLWSAGQLELLNRTFLAWHLSGGTTELLLVRPGLMAEKLGGTTDLSAGQLIDRTGQLLGLDFPAGKALDSLAGDIAVKPFPVKLRDCAFSLSGMQNQMQRRRETGAPPEEIAAFVLATIADTVRRATDQARAQHGTLPVILTGGVASNRQLRQVMEPRGGVFGTPQCSTDNALGIAVLAHMGGQIHG